MLADLSAAKLLEICLMGSVPGAWKEFVRRLQPVITSNVTHVARQYGLATTSLIEDIVQDVYLRLCEDNCRVLWEFRSENPDGLYSFLKVVAGNVARDSCTAMVALKRGSGKVTALPNSDNTLAAPAEASTGVEWQLLMGEIDEILMHASVETRQRDRNVFWLYYRQGFTSQEIASIGSFGLTSKGVESLLQRMVRNVRTQLVSTREKGIPTENSF